jgi:hypothetical protein
MSFATTFAPPDTVKALPPPPGVVTSSAGPRQRSLIWHRHELHGDQIVSPRWHET